jgi:hypothetical protein
MADFVRHGGAGHFMRPDRVIRTSVLSPMVGYDPHADVQAVAMEFTQGPQRGMMLQGLGQAGPIRRWWEGVKMRMAARRAQRFMQVSGLGMPGPAPVVATQISPHLATQMTGMLEIMHRRYGQGYPAAQAMALVERPLRAWYR